MTIELKQSGALMLARCAHGSKIFFYDKNRLVDYHSPQRPNKHQLFPLYDRLPSDF